jgi:hypothetical protein
MPTEPEDAVMYEGRMVPYKQAEHWVLLLEHAATAATFIAEPGTWPAYAQWLLNVDPSLPVIGRSELARQGCEADAGHLVAMAYVARRKLEEACNERN